MSAVLCENPSRNRYMEALEVYRDIPHLLGFKSWESFVAERGISDRECPFVITLRTRPRPDIETTPRAPVNTGSKHAFFGHLTREKRSDGRLGRDCFGQESKDFGGNGETGGFSIVIRDGLDPGFLKTPKERVDELDRDCVRGDLYKVTGLHTKPEAVAAMLIGLIQNMANAVPDYPDMVVAARVVKFYRQAAPFLRSCGEAGNGAEAGQALKKLEECSERRWRAVQSEFRGHLRKARELHREMKNLRAR